MSVFDPSAALRRIRRTADLSQRELAERIGASKSAIGRIECGHGGLDVGLLVRAAALAGLRLALLDESGQEVRGMSRDAVRDRSGRRFPAHLDTMLSEERWWRWDIRRDRAQPSYTFDRRARWEAPARRRADRPDDHLLAQPGDAPWERAAARRAEARRRAAEEHERRFLAGELRDLPESFACTCPARCDELDDWSGKPVHAEDCACACDID
ncbi:helix-turn-helix transcriptional regulator [Blastococcus sp. LR1]|uniref:helix-turn-helix domain-containing protein n=1 Tax=Blastococcus sp. LR1 TaxID=2877000 RepID=UPI001CCF0AD6|nr:helix-turn-helix transcriptional regulator [Blastococcus sp. LR1]MCA0144798.1 helix-turn-helix transcriptional regulator [Blastococcus sp. LR1]